MTKLKTQYVYHIYLNDRCIHANVSEEKFEQTFNAAKGFLSLTGTEKFAKIDYERCEMPIFSPEASY